MVVGRFVEKLQVISVGQGISAQRALKKKVRLDARKAS